MIQNNDGLSTADLEDIKSRIDRGEEPEVITEKTSSEQSTDAEPQETPDFKHPAEERLYQLQKIITDNRQKLGSNSISSLEKFISQAQTLLGNEKHSSKWSILEKRIEGVVQDLQKQVQS
jgi:molecular chaperone DnaK (HSP70)